MPARAPAVVLGRIGQRWADLAPPSPLDVLVAAVALVCLIPVILLIALFICAETGRPVFFSQTRLGRHGRHFKLYKFRKFGPAESVNGRGVTLRDDPRLTRFGRILERTKLDELPQLWNVLKGDMSLVGPRPESLRFADCFSDAYSPVLEYRPGIFGPSQAIFRDEGSLYQDSSDPEQFYREVLFPAKARLDLAYYPSRNALRDVAWIGRGVLAVAGRAPFGEADLTVLEQVEDWLRSAASEKASVTVRMG